MCASRWSGAKFSHTATEGRNQRVVAKRNEEASTTKTSISGSEIASTKGVSVLPQAIDRTPEARSIAVTMVVTVVFPSVPVMATIGRESHRSARSNSDSIATPSALASPKIGWDSGIPGLGTTRSHPETRRVSSCGEGDSTSSTPIDAASARIASVGCSSTATTETPREVRAVATARPVTPNPRTSADRSGPRVGASISRLPLAIARSRRSRCPAPGQ
ncbi:unannotated protein [freshwater metagenome]|uniref:Unannotated protein n=1 Tax=freshwater metagenome TaxID=449393 RepID=A0A6J6DPM9_9ZZZZ